MRLPSLLVGVALACTASLALEAAEPLSGKVPVVFEGGHETEGVDRGRPVVLVAGALGVQPEVFREAFSRVKPMAPGQPEAPGQVQNNKRVLMEALGKYGINNDRLDAVSNHYRYRRDQDELWPTKPAEAYVVVERGVIKSFVVTKGGEGYSSAPRVKVPGVSDDAGEVQLGFSKRFEQNGAVVKIAPKAQR